MDSTADPNQRPADQPITVSIVNDYELIVEGVRSLLAKHDDRVVVVDTEVGDTSDASVDVALMDTFSALQPSIDRARRMLDSGRVRAAILYTWNVEEAHLLIKGQRGFAGVVGKSATAEELVRSIELAARGQLLTPRHLHTVDMGDDPAPLIEPLSERESEVIALIAEGHSNAEIARLLHVSAESIKTYASRAYLKIGVRNRAQAASWAVRNGLQSSRRSSSRTG